MRVVPLAVNMLAVVVLMLSGGKVAIVDAILNLVVPAAVFQPIIHQVRLVVAQSWVEQVAVVVLELQAFLVA